MRDFLAVMNALSDENRLRILLTLRDRELCLCQIVEMLSLATSTVSKHMSILQQARLVNARKEGRWTFFRLVGTDSPEAARKVSELVITSLANDQTVREDAKRIEKILKLNPEELCRAQSACK